MDELEKMIEAVQATVKGLLDEFKSEFTKEADERSTEKLETLERKIEEQAAKLAELKEKDAKSYSLPGSEPTGDEKNDFNYARAARAIQMRDFSQAGLEKEVFDNMRKQRDLGTQTGSEGGYIVPIQQSGDIIDRLRDKVIAERLGARVMDGGNGMPLFIPRLASSVTATWLAENGTITDTDVSFDQIEMRPRELAAMSKLSMKLIENSAPAADAIVRDDFVKQFALAVDEAVMNGSGNNQPIGIINTSGVQTHAISGGTLSYTDFVDMVFDISSANADTGKLGWAINNGVAGRIQKIGNESGAGEGSTDIEVGRKLFTEAPLSMLMGYKFETTANANALPATGSGSIIFGNWDDLMVAYWKRLELRASDTAGTAYAQNQVWIRGITSVDTAVRQPASFVMSTGLA